MKSSATMCKLARAIATMEEPTRTANIIGYSASVKEIRTLYIRNGFQNIDDILLRHIKQWGLAGMAFKINERIYFYLDEQDWSDRDSFDRLIKTADSAGMPDLTIIGFMS